MVNSDSATAAHESVAETALDSGSWLSRLEALPSVPLLTGLVGLTLLSTSVAIWQDPSRAWPSLLWIAPAVFLLVALRRKLRDRSFARDKARLASLVAVFVGLGTAGTHLMSLGQAADTQHLLLWWLIGLGGMLLPTPLLGWAQVGAIALVPFAPWGVWLSATSGLIIASGGRLGGQFLQQHLAAELEETRGQLQHKEERETELEEAASRYEDLISEASDILICLDVEGRATRISDGLESLTGWGVNQWCNQPFASLLHPEDRTPLAEFLATPTNEGVIPRTWRLLSRSGDFAEVQLKVIRHQGSEGLLGFTVIASDMSREKLLAQLLEESEERFRLAAKGANDGLWDWDIQKGTIFFSDRWKAMIGHSADEIDNRPEEWFSRLHPDDVRQVRSAILLHLDGESESFETNYRLKNKEGAYQWMACRGLAVRDGASKASRMVGSQTDVTSFKENERQLLHDAFHDPLTGLANRALFIDRLAHAIKRFKSNRNYFFALLFLDLDRFKVINDSLGHEAGDRMLSRTARRLEACVRGGDTVARLGGDEFTVLLEDIRSAADATRVAEKIQRELSRPFSLGGQEVFTTASIGIAFSKTGYDKPVELLRDADIAMYRAKMQGKARHEVFDHEMHARAVALLQTENDIRRALDRKEFTVYYQPIVSMKTGELQGFEALVRWEHPDRGLLLPGEFLDVADDTGLIMPISWWVLREACRQLRLWQKRFATGTPLSASVNLSARHFTQPDLADELTAALASAGLEPQWLNLEITEGALMEDKAIDQLTRLKALGVDLHLDDFGTGYSSLNYLHRFPIDASKIDRSFVSGMVEDPEKAQIVQTIVNLSHNLGMKVVAEGVETAEQAARLRLLNCEYAQGFLYSRPLPAYEADKLIASLYGTRSPKARQFRLPACG